MFIQRKIELYSLSNKLIKIFHGLEVKKVGDRWVLARYEMTDAMKETSRTEFVLKDVKIDLKLDPATFSLEELSW